MHARLTLGLCALLALLLSGCGRATSPTSPGLTPSRSGASARAGLSAGDAGGGVTTPAAPAGPKDAAPEARIVDPQPNPFLLRYFVPDEPVTVHWAATDPDGPGPGVKSFRYIVLDYPFPQYPGNGVFLTDPDSLLRRDGPAFTNWTEVDGRVDQVTLTGLSIHHPYVLYLIAFDRRGQHDEHLELTRNVLQFSIEHQFNPSAAQAGAPGVQGRSPHGD